jgi:hypothetical protein
MIYPPNLVLVNHISYRGFAMDMLAQRPFCHRLDVAGPEEQKAIEHVVNCQVMNAYYLAGVQVKPLEGPLPKGHLQLTVDGEILLEGALSSFKGDASEWVYHPQSSIFRAALIQDGQVLHKEPIGFFLPNGSHLKIYLRLEKPLEKAALDVAILGADYKSNGKAPIDLVEPKEAKS